MKLIGILQGAAAARESQEEYMPERIPPFQDVVDLIRSTYQFVQFPVVAPGGPPPTAYAFTAGRFTMGSGDVFSITQILMTTDGDIVTAGSTDQAELVLEHLLKLLKDHFGYRFDLSAMPKKYLSNVVVEFDDNLVKYFVKIGKIEQLINDVSKINKPFKIKRLAFGTEVLATPPADPLVMIETADFLIERRVGRSLEENRYFCSAPMRTSDHIRALEQIEAIMRSEDGGRAPAAGELVVEHTRPRMVVAPPSRRRIKLERDKPISK
jgi:hypothetical protein